MTATRVLSAAIVAMLWFAVAPLAKEDPQSRWLTREQRATQHALRFAGDGQHTLEVRTTTGAITIEAYDGNEVDMIVSKVVRGETEEDLRDAEREVELDVADNARVVGAVVRQRDQPVCGDEFNNNWPSRGWRRRYDVRYDFMIRVPRNTRLDLCTINKGDVTVSGTRADFEIRSVNGRITMTGVGGSGQATTVNGRVTATFAAVPRMPSLFKTINGDIVVSFPERLAADLRLKTFNGGLYTDFETQPVPARAVAIPQRENGRFVYRNQYTTVRVGGGGPELTLDAFNGDVRVLRAR